MFTQPLEMSPSSFLQKCMFFNPKNDFPLFSNKNESTHPYLFQLLHSTTSYHGYVMKLVSMTQRDHSMRKTSRIIVQDGTVAQTISPVKRTVSTLENDRSMCILLGIDIEIVAESQLSAIPSISSTSEKERERLRRTMKNQMENKVCYSICMEMCRSCQRNCHLR